MKILHVADLHLQRGWFDWVESHCDEYDLLVIAGDLQNAFSNISMHEQAKAIRAWLLSLYVRGIVVCSGNHDFWVGDQRATKDVYAEAGWLHTLRGRVSHGRRRILAIDGDTIQYKGLSIAVNGWLKVPNLNKCADIVVTHAPPSGCACAGGEEGRDVGDSELWPALQDSPPRLLLCGHVHAPAKYACSWPPIDPTSLILVPGCDENADVPAHWMIDTDSKVAIHSGGEKVRWCDEDPDACFAQVVARSRGIEDETLAEEGGAADDAEFANTLGCSVAELLSRAETHEVFSIWHGNRRHWPRWQFHAGKPLPGLRDTLILLAEKQADDFSVASFFLCPTYALYFSNDQDLDVRENDSPLSLLRRCGSRGVPLVVQHVQRFGEHGAL